MSTQARQGVLYIFMPPTRCLEDYLELVAAVEATAEELVAPVILEGYESRRAMRAWSVSASRPIPVSSR